MSYCSFFFGFSFTKGCFLSGPPNFPGVFARKRITQIQKIYAYWKLQINAFLKRTIFDGFIAILSKKNDDSFGTTFETIRALDVPKYHIFVGMFTRKIDFRLVCRLSKY